MTRTERATLRAQKLKDALDLKKRELAQVQAQQRAAERTERTKRRLAVGMLAEEHGLFAFDHTTLAGMFQALQVLHDVPNPVAVLEGLLASTGRLDPVSVNGTAHAGHGVGPTCRVG